MPTLRCARHDRPRSGGANRAARRSAVRPLVQKQRKIEAEIETHTRLVDDLEHRLTLASGAAQGRRNQRALGGAQADGRRPCSGSRRRGSRPQEKIDAMGGEKALR